MFDIIKKRDGRDVHFDEGKITEAIFKAAKAVGGEDKQTAMELTIEVLKYLKHKFNGVFTVEDVQDAVEKVLIETGHAKTAKAYILYRAQRNSFRDAKSDLMDTVSEILKETDRENANVSNSPSAKMLQIAMAASKKYYLGRVIPQEMAYRHTKGDLHIHDLDFYGKTVTCNQNPLGRLLAEGFNTGHGFIRSPKRIGSAAALACIILQSAQNDMHGGQSFAFFDRDMAPFAENATEEEVYQAMEALVYNLNSMHSRAGAQVPFSSLNVGTDTTEGGRKVTRNVLLAYEKGLGKGENPIFPNIIFKVKEGVNFLPGDPNYDLFQLALRVTARRMNPTYTFLDASFNKGYKDEVATMGCRTRVIGNVNGPEVTERRGNLSFTTINLPRVALKAKGDIQKFYAGLDEILDVAKEQLLHRYKIQSSLKVKDMPFLMGQSLYMDSDDLDLEDTLEEALKHGTLSIGFIGLAETLKALVGEHHGESEQAHKLGLEIVSYMRNRCDRYARELSLNYTLLGTPAEGLSGRFTKMDRKEFGEIPGVTDREYYTNSCHVPVHHDISLHDKVTIEGAYHKYLNAGHILYVELASVPKDNTEALENILRHMAASDVGYAGINFPIDFCTTCGHLGVINEDTCPVCEEATIRRIRRITGYFSEVNNFNTAKRAELDDRVKHSSEMECIR